MLDTLNSMNISWSEVQYGPPKKYDGSVKFGSSIIEEDIIYADLKISFFIHEKSVFKKPKRMFVNIFQNQKGKLLIKIEKADLSIMYG